MSEFTYPQNIWVQVENGWIIRTPTKAEIAERQCKQSVPDAWINNDVFKKYCVDCGGCGS